jgi:hypothetical protein
MFRPEKTPMMRKQTPVYRTPVLSEVINMTVPTAERRIGPMTCQTESLNFPEDQPKPRIAR